MRLFPPAFEGLHPAVPTPEPPQSPSMVVNTLGTVGVLLGVASPAAMLVLPTFTSAAAAWHIVGTASAYTFIGFTAMGASVDVGRHIKAKAFLKEQGISMGTAKLFD